MTQRVDDMANLGSSAGVLRNLVRLRERSGVTPEKMRDARDICALQVVLDELIRRNKSPADVSAVAYKILECVAQSETLLGHENCLILTTTLNFTGPDSILDERRVQVQNLMRIGTKAYERIEKTAYQKLATLLVGLDQYPCRGASDASKWKKLESDMRAYVDGQADRDMAKAIAGYSYGRDDLSGIDIAIRTLKKLRTGYARFREFNVRLRNLQPDKQLDLMLGALIDNGYPSWVAQDRISSRQHGHRVFLTPSSLSKLVLVRSIDKTIHDLDTAYAEDHRRMKETPANRYLYWAIEDPPYPSFIKSRFTPQELFRQRYLRVQSANDRNFEDGGEAGREYRDIGGLPESDMVPTDVYFNAVNNSLALFGQMLSTWERNDDWDPILRLPDAQPPAGKPREPRSPAFPVRSTIEDTPVRARSHAST